MTLTDLPRETKLNQTWLLLSRCEHWAIVKGLLYVPLICYGHMPSGFKSDWVLLCRHKLARKQSQPVRKSVNFCLQPIDTFCAPYPHLLVPSPLGTLKKEEHDEEENLAACFIPFHS
jgi:hypothetical protein